jgi:hypothetical protein
MKRDPPLLKTQLRCSQRYSAVGATDLFGSDGRLNKIALNRVTAGSFPPQR